MPRWLPSPSKHPTPSAPATKLAMRNPSPASGCSMKKSGFSLFLVVALLAMLVGGNRLYAMLVAGSNHHLAKSDCASCHLSGKNVSPEQAGKLIASQEA